MSCNNDDDGLSVEEQNTVDDNAIEVYLTEHYFNERGIITRFNDEDEFDDDFATLMSLATRDNSGYWYVQNPNVNATGDALTSNETDSLLVTYILSYFIAENDEDPYSTMTPYASTLNSTGLPSWDPTFYYSGIQEEDITAQNRPEFFEIEGIVNGLQNFRTTNRNLEDVYEFQGAIVVPSRLAFARDINLSSVPANASFVFNFEAVKRLDRQ